MRLNKTTLFFGVMGWGLLLSACQPSNRQLLQEAETKRLYRKSDIARALYFKILRDHATKDDIRYRAYVGLISTLRDQLYNAVDAAEAMERLIEEFGSETLYRASVDEWRLELATIYLVSLDRIARAKRLMDGLEDRWPQRLDIQERLANIFTRLSEWDKAEKHLMVAWELASAQKACQSIRSLQVLAIHMYQLMKRCDRALKWSQDHTQLASCPTDHFAIVTEKAHCYEMLNEPQRAIDILTDYQSKYPENKRVMALISQLRTRESRKDQR